MIPSRTKFLNEVKKSNFDENIKKDLISIYEHLLGNEKIENIEILVDQTIKKLFPAVYSTDNMIPYSFVSTSIGTVLFTALFKEDKLLTVNEVMEISGFTRQYITQEIKAGNLNAEKISSVWKLREKEVYDYLESKKKKKEKSKK